MSVSDFHGLEIKNGDFIGDPITHYCGRNFFLNSNLKKKREKQLEA